MKVFAEGRWWQTQKAKGARRVPTLSVSEAKAFSEIEWITSSPHSVECIAACLGISARSVSRIESRALAKLKALIIAGGEEIYAEGVREPRLLSEGPVYMPSSGMTRRRGPDYED